MKRIKVTLEGKLDYWAYLNIFCEQINYEGGALAAVRNRDAEAMQRFNEWLIKRKRDRPAINAIVGKLPYVDGRPLYGLIRKPNDRTEADYINKLIADLDSESLATRLAAKEALIFLNEYNLHLTGNSKESKLRLPNKIDREIKDERAASSKDILNIKPHSRTSLEGLELESLSLADAVDAARIAKKEKLSKLRKKKPVDGGSK